MIEYLKYVQEDETKSYAKYLLAYHCMPTLLKIKPSTLVNANKKYIQNTYQFLEALSNQILNFESLYYLLNEDETRYVFLIYNREILNKVLCDKGNEETFGLYGYKPDRLKREIEDRIGASSKNGTVVKVKDKAEDKAEDKAGDITDVERAYLDKLSQRYQEYAKYKQEFPHEIGLFLGYPLCDVTGFIRNKGKHYLSNGFWKVYHDAEQAERTFELFRRIRKDAMQTLEEEKDLRDLNVLYRIND